MEKELCTSTELKHIITIIIIMQLCDVPRLSYFSRLCSVSITLWILCTRLSDEC